MLHRPGAEDPAGQKAPRAAPELEKLAPSAAMQHLPELQVTPQPLASSTGSRQPSCPKSAVDAASSQQPAAKTRQPLGWSVLGRARSEGTATLEGRTADSRRDLAAWSTCTGSTVLPAGGGGTRWNRLSLRIVRPPSVTVMMRSLWSSVVGRLAKVHSAIPPPPTRLTEAWQVGLPKIRQRGGATYGVQLIPSGKVPGYY